MPFRQQATNEPALPSEVGAIFVKNEIHPFGNGKIDLLELVEIITLLSYET